jgi:hypothetical protein
VIINIGKDQGTAIALIAKGFNKNVALNTKREGCKCRHYVLVQGAAQCTPQWTCRRDLSELFLPGF